VTQHPQADAQNDSKSDPSTPNPPHLQTQPHQFPQNHDEDHGGDPAQNAPGEDDGRRYRRPPPPPIPQVLQPDPQLPAQLALLALPRHDADEPVETQPALPCCRHQNPLPNQNHRNPQEQRHRRQTPPGENDQLVLAHQMNVMMIDDEDAGWFRQNRNYVKAYQNSAGQKSKKQQSTQADRSNIFAGMNPAAT